MSMLHHDIMNRMNTQDRITPSPSSGPIPNQVHHFDSDAVSVCPTSDGVSIFRCNLCGKSYGTWGQIQMHLDTHRLAKRPDVKNTMTTSESDCSFGLSNPQHFARSPSVHVDERKVMEGMNTNTDKMTDCSFEACQSDPVFPRASSIAEDSSTSNSVSTAKPQMQQTANLMDKADGGFGNRQNKPVENINTGDPLTLYICNLCGTSFETKHRLDGHLAEHRSKNEEKHVDDYSFGCNLCSKSFTAQELFDEHMSSHRQDRVASYMTYTAQADMPYTCNICREGFEILDDLRNHIDVHTSVHSLNNISGGDGSGSVKNKCFSCQICDKSCSSWEQLKSHVTKHESVVMGGGQDATEGRQFQCDKCKKSFNVWGHLKAHLMRHQNEALSKNYVPSTHGSMVFSCEVCDKVFVAKSHLLGHMKTHTDPVACDVCGKLFQTQQHVNRHKVMHTGERPHKCDVCGMRFMRKEHCKRHILTHISDKSLLATCEICDKSFSRPEHLQRHYRMHTGEKPFKCDICVKEYSRKDRLQHHMKSHEREVRQVLSESSESVSDSVDYNFARFSAQNLAGVDSLGGDSTSGGPRPSISTHQRMQNSQSKTATGRNVNVFNPCNKSPPLVTSATVLSSVGLVSSSVVSKSRMTPDEGGSNSKPLQMSAAKTSPSKKDLHDVGFGHSSASFREDGSASTLSSQNISTNLHQSTDHTINRMFSDQPSGHDNSVHTQKSVGSYIPSCLPLTVESMSHCKPSYVPHLSDFAASMGQRSQVCSSVIPVSARSIAHCQTSFVQSASVLCDNQSLHNDRYDVKPSVNVMGQPCVDSSSRGVHGSLSNLQAGDLSRK
ncbi:zinc finger protein 813-like [Gigantopelta aegis]|uniref:zinc finger protein 813-like n=1 Tax=Gigantopelta aegis TaxID=1735272 RepID=UPI001B88804A|nr:zinc finger protein 813-like [Gigantopelta aegis]